MTFSISLSFFVTFFISFFVYFMSLPFSVVPSPYSLIPSPPASIATFSPFFSPPSLYPYLLFPCLSPPRKKSLLPHPYLVQPFQVEILFSLKNIYATTSKFLQKILLHRMSDLLPFTCPKGTHQRRILLDGPFSNCVSSKLLQGNIHHIEPLSTRQGKKQNIVIGYSLVPTSKEIPLLEYNIFDIFVKLINNIKEQFIQAVGEATWRMNRYVTCTLLHPLLRRTLMKLYSVPS